jgi:hypothetical protein
MSSVNATSWQPEQDRRGHLAEKAAVIFEFFLGWNKDAEWT